MQCGARGRHINKSELLCSLLTVCTKSGGSPAEGTVGWAGAEGDVIGDSSEDRKFKLDLEVSVRDSHLERIYRGYLRMRK